MSKAPKQRTAPAIDESVDTTILEPGLGAGALNEGDDEALMPVDPSHYAIGEEIARGGMGRILEGRDRRIGRSVAIKEVLLELLKIYPDEERDHLLRRFEREARITARLEHPAIVPVYEIGRLDDAPFFAMKKVDGRPLGDLIAEADTLADRLRLLPSIIAVCEALGYAHERGVIHRDLKPANILAGAHGETVVIDWGLAKQVDGADPDTGGNSDIKAPVLDSQDGLKTRLGSVFGTPLYMAPEQARGEPVDRRADVYSLGSILYHLLSGGAPYVGTKKKARKISVLEMLIAAPPEPLSDLVRGVPPDLVSIVEKAMSRDPDDRYASAIELAEDLRQFEAGQLVGVHDYSIGEHLRRWVGRNRAAVATAALAALALAVVAGVLVQKLRAAKDSAMEWAMSATDSRKRATTLFSELGRSALMRDELVEASFGLLQAGLLNSDAPRMDVLFGEVERTLGGVITRIDKKNAEVLQFTEDGETMLAGFLDGTVSILSTEDGKERIRLQGPSQLRNVTANRDASLVLIAPHRGEAQLWDTSTGEVIQTFSCPLLNKTVPTMGASISPDGKLVVVACAIGNMNVYEARSGERVGGVEFPFPDPQVVFSPDSERLMLVSSAHVVLLLDLIEGKTLRMKQVAHTTGLITASHRFKMVGAITEEKVEFFNLETDESFAIGNPARAHYFVAVSPTAEFAALATGDGYIGLIDLETGKTIRRWRAHTSRVVGLTISRDGERIATLSDNHVVRIWDTESGHRRSTLLGPTGGASLAFNKDATRLAVNDGSILLLDATLEEGRVLRFEGSKLSPIEYSPDSKLIRVGDGSRTHILRDGRIKTIEARVASPGGAAFSQDGRRFVLDRGVYNADSLELIGPLPIEDSGTTVVVISGDGRIAAARLTSGIVVAWRIESGDIIYESQPEPDPGAVPFGILLNNDGTVLATGSLNAGVTFTDLVGGERTVATSAGAAMLFGAQGRDIVVAHGRRQLIILDFKTRTEIATVTEEGKWRPVPRIRGPEFVARGSRGRLASFELRTGELVREFNPSLTFRALTVAVGGGLVVATDSNGTIRVWDMATGTHLLQRHVASAVTSIAIAPDGTEVSVALVDELYTFTIPKAKLTPHQLLMRLGEIYPASFIERYYRAAD